MSTTTSIHSGSHVARLACGCIVGAISVELHAPVTKRSRESWRREIIRTTGEWVARGYKVETLTLAELRAANWHGTKDNPCEACRKPEAPKVAQEAMEL
jgi:hypothetical protein